MSQKEQNCVENINLSLYEINKLYLEFTGKHGISSLPEKILK